MTENEREFEEVTDIEEANVTTEVEENGNIAKKIIIGVSAIGAAALTTVVVKKLRLPEKINEHRKRKLEKAGYVCFKREELEDPDDTDVEEDTEE